MAVAARADAPNAPAAMPAPAPTATAVTAPLMSILLCVGYEPSKVLPPLKDIDWPSTP
jgi:hypothetical protein